MGVREIKLARLCDLRSQIQFLYLQMGILDAGLHKAVEGNAESLLTFLKGRKDAADILSRIKAKISLNAKVSSKITLFWFFRPSDAISDPDHCSLQFSHVYRECFLMDTELALKEMPVLVPL